MFALTHTRRRSGKRIPRELTFGLVNEPTLPRFVFFEGRLGRYHRRIALGQTWWKA